MGTDDRFTDEEIFSYISGDLSESSRAALNDRIARNPQLAERLEKLRRDRRDLVAEFHLDEGDEADEASSGAPVPAEERAGPSATAANRNVVRRPLAWMAMAATAALFAVGGFGIGAWQGTAGDTSTMQVLNAIDDVRNQALETAANSDVIRAGLPGGATAEIRPLTTYMDEQGRFCRAYETVITSGAEVIAQRGHACRTEGAWTVQAQRPTALDDQG